MKRKEGAFLFGQALVVAGVLALLILPLNSANVSQTTSSSTASSSAALSMSQSSSSTATAEPIRDLGGGGEVVGTNSDLNLGLFLNSLVDRRREQRVRPDRREEPDRPRDSCIRGQRRGRAGP